MSRWVKRSRESPEPPHPGGPVRSSTCAALAQDHAGGCLQPTSLQRNRPCYSAGGTPPLSPSVPPAKGSRLVFQPASCSPSTARPIRLSPGKLLGQREQGWSCGDAGGCSGGSSSSCPRLRGCPWQRSRAGLAAVAVPSREKQGLASPRHLPVPRQERTGSPGELSPTPPQRVGGERGPEERT